MRKFLLFFLVLFAVALVACTDFERQTFQTLATLQQTYNSVEQVYTSGRKAGTISAQDYATYKRIADDYVPLHNTAVNYLFAYHSAVSAGDTQKQAAIKASLQALVPELVQAVEKLKALHPVQVSTSYVKPHTRTARSRFVSGRQYRGGAGLLRGADCLNS